MTMKFKRFNDIENSSRALTVNYIVQNGLSGGLWIATEKVDGANFSMWANSAEFRAGKRNSMLQESEYMGFNRCDTVIDKYSPNIQEIYRYLKVEKKAEDSRAYGELYGGYYPTADPSTAKNATRLQSDKVFYCPHIDFIGYNILVDGVYMNTLDALELFEEFEIPSVPILGIGSFEEMLLVRNDTVTQIPLMHKMPLIPQERFSQMLLPELNNIIEGVVISPNEATFMGSGSRVVLKNKNIRFTEKNKVKVIKVVEPLTDDQQRIYEDMHAQVTENRLRNVLSKFGEVTNKDFGKILGQMNGDVIKDHMLDNPEDGLTTIDKKDRKVITKMINIDIGNLIRPNFLNIIDRTW